MSQNYREDDKEEKLLKKTYNLEKQTKDLPAR